jgi:hypothetical protein
MIGPFGVKTASQQHNRYHINYEVMFADGVHAAAVGLSRD